MINIRSEEVKRAMERMGKNKALSCDGISDYIFQKKA